MNESERAMTNAPPSRDGRGPMFLLPLHLQDAFQKNDFDPKEFGL